MNGPDGIGRPRQVYTWPSAGDVPIVDSEGHASSAVAGVPVVCAREDDALHPSLD